jgi:hypothetical protein
MNKHHTLLDACWQVKSWNKCQAHRLCATITILGETTGKFQITRNNNKK